MENVFYSKEIANDSAEHMGESTATLYLTQESNGWAIWLLDGTHYLVKFFRTHDRNQAIEEAVRLARMKVREIRRDAIANFHQPTM